MAKVSKINLRLKSDYGENYEVHYNAKKQPGFSVKGLPEDFTAVTQVKVYGYDTEDALGAAIRTGVQNYKAIKQQSKKVIVYKASATGELTMIKKAAGHYIGKLPGISQKIDSFGYGAEEASFGITYNVMMEVETVGVKKYHYLKEDGSMGSGKTLTRYEQVMDHTEKRELFFANIYESMRLMVQQISKFIDADSQAAAFLIDNSKNGNLLGS